MSSTRKFTFAQGEPELPSGYIVPEPVEETPAEEGVTGETQKARPQTALPRQRVKPPQMLRLKHQRMPPQPGRPRSRTDCTADPR